MGIRFDPKVAQALFEALREKPDILDIKDTTMESSLILLKKIWRIWRIKISWEKNIRWVSCKLLMQRLERACNPG